MKLQKLEVRVSETSLDRLVYIIKREGVMHVRWVIVCRRSEPLFYRQAPYMANPPPLLSFF